MDNIKSTESINVVINSLNMFLKSPLEHINLIKTYFDILYAATQDLINYLPQNQKTIYLEYFKNFDTIFNTKYHYYYKECVEQIVKPSYSSDIIKKLKLVIKLGIIYNELLLLNNSKNVRVDLPEKKIKLAREDNETNYGHNNLIWKGDISFPKTKLVGGADTPNYSYGYSYNETNDIFEKPFDKKVVVDKAVSDKKLLPVSNQKEYLEIYRYGLNSFNKPNDLDGPTLSISLFMPNSVLYKTNDQGKLDYSSWTIRYYQNQIMLCVVFNYYFPNGNYRNYFDHYMLEQFKKIDGNDDSLKITKQSTNFNYTDFETSKGEYVADILNQFYTELQKYENYPFSNGLERFIHSFDLASRCYNNNGKLEIRPKTGDFFVYKYKGPFIEKANTPEEGHITNGYIGQLIRYISLRQDKYKWNNEIVKIPIHLVWRDAHTNCIGYNDYLWINELNKYANDYKELYFLPNSLGYIPDWHDIVHCSSNDKYYKRSIVAGIVQVINTKMYSNDEIYLNSIGLAFIVDNKNELPISEHRLKGMHYANNKALLNYDYGIDEYVLSNFFIIDYIKQRTIIFNNKRSWELFVFDRKEKYYYYMNNAIMFILNFLLKEHRIQNETSIKYIMKEIEYLRHSPNLGNEIGLLLSFIPNKYQVDWAMFNNFDLKNITDKVINIKKTISDYHKGDQNIIKKLDNITRDNLEYFGLNCKTNATNMIILDWCQYPYLEKDNISKNTCPPANFLSGYYDEIPPSLDIGILRQPYDLKFSLSALENNILKIRLDKSDYKLKTYSDKLKLYIQNKGQNINPVLQYIILKYGKTNYVDNTEGEMIAEKTLLLNIKDVFTPLIWKALNYSNYDIPPEWYIVKFTRNDDYRRFNEIVKLLSNLDGWAEYAITVLSEDNDNYNMADNNFDSKIVKQKSELYKSRSLTKDQLKEYKMDSYDKDYKDLSKYTQLYKLNELTLLNIIKKLNIDSKNVNLEMLDFISNATIHPCFHAITWYMLKYITELLGKNNNFMMMDSGNGMAFMEYNIIEYPWDDDIDIGFLTDDKYNDIKKLIKTVTDYGFDVYYYTRDPNQTLWYKDLVVKSHKDFDLNKVSQETIWFFKIALPNNRYKPLKKKYNIPSYYFSEEYDVTPWIDVFPITKINNKYMTRWYKELNTFGDGFNITKITSFGPVSIHVPTNLENATDKYKTRDFYNKKDKIYNHISKSKMELTYNSDESKIIKEYIKDHNNKILSYVYYFGSLFYYENKYLKYKKKYLELKNNK